MTLTEILLIILIIVVVAFILFWFFRGSTGRISWRRPVESRVDEYLDRRLEKLIEEYDLVQGPRMRRFNESKNTSLEQDEELVRTLRSSESEIASILDDLEERLNVLETSLDSRKK